MKPVARALGLPWRVFRLTATTLAQAHGLLANYRLPTLDGRKLQAVPKMLYG